MIGKQVKGESFRGVLNYLHQKEKAQLIGGNMAGQTPRILAAEFGIARELNPRLNKAVYHASLSLPKKEQLDSNRWNVIAEDYVKGMGFEGSQYVVYRHGDRDHDHVHIVASRIRVTDGSTVSDSWDYVRSEKLIRSLEKQYDLTPAPPSQSKERKAPKTGELRRFWRTQEPGVRGTLLATIDQASAGEPTVPQFMEQLKDSGINARVKITRTGKARGISYELNGIAYSGTKLGKAYTFPGLQKHRGVRYQPEMNDRIEALNQQPAASVEPIDIQEVEQTVPPMLNKLLKVQQQFEYEGDRFCTYYKDGGVVLTHAGDDDPAVSASWNEDEQSWELDAPPRLSQVDLEKLRRTDQRLDQEVERLRHQRQQERSLEPTLEL
ncbi:MAG: relaxase/mobilization nuclease domain-containing protein [Cyanobacteria bacterium J06638_20]